MSEDKEKVITEIYEFLVRLDAKPKKKSPANVRKPVNATEWTELLVPKFRDFRVFAKDDASAIIMVVHTHVSHTGELFYHVIEESLDAPDHNGEYMMLSEEEFHEMYNCEIISED